MLSKTVTSLAFATACMTALATMPAQAQMAPPAGPPAYSGAPAYQGGGMPAYSGQMGGTDVITNGPQGTPPANWSARQNVIESHRYDRMLESSRGFREARMRKECGPITDQQLHQQCLASFHQDEPYAGSSSPRRPARSDYGR